MRSWWNLPRWYPNQHPFWSATESGQRWGPDVLFSSLCILLRIAWRSASQHSTMTRWTFTFCYGKIHHAINGKIHDFDWAIFHCYVNVHQRVWLGASPRNNSSLFVAWFYLQRQRSSIVSSNSLSLCIAKESQPTWAAKVSVLPNCWLIGPGLD